MSGKGPKGRSHRDPGGSAQDVMGESETARTPARGSGVGATAAMVEAVDRDRVDGDIGPGDTFHAPPQQSRPTPGKGDNWRTEHPTHVASPICVTAGSPGAGPLRCPVWRQSRRSSQMPGVTPRTAITVDGQGYKLVGDPGEIPTVQVKGGTNLRDQEPEWWVC